MVVDPAFLSLFFAGLCIAVGYQLFATYGPTYFEALGLRPTKAGIMLAIPYLVSIIAKVVVGPLVDRCVGLSLRIRTVYLQASCQVRMNRWRPCYDLPV